jgi:nucleolar protein 53
MLRENTVPKAISMPHPGESYNPTLTDHQKLLAVEHARALAEEQKAAILAATKLKIMDGREDYRDSRETGYADEVGSGDEDEEEDAEDGEEGGENGETSEKKKKKQRRKTDKERRRRQANIALEVGR